MTAAGAELRVAGQCQMLGRDGSSAGSSEQQKNARSSGLSKRPEPQAAHTHARAEPPCSRHSVPWPFEARPFEPAPTPSAPPTSPHDESAPTPSHPFVETRPWCTRADPRRLRYASRLHAPPPPVLASRALSETGHARAHPAHAFASRFPPVVRPRDLSPNPSFTPPRLTRKRLFAFRAASMPRSAASARRRNPEALRRHGHREQP